MFFINPFIFAAGGDFESIATVTVGSGGASSIEFTSIPGTYQHLQVRLVARQTNTSAGGAAAAKTRLNGDTGNNYNFIYPLRIASTTQRASVCGIGVADILDYANTSKYTVVRGFTGYDNNGSGTIYLNSNLWMSTAAVTSISMVPTSGNFAEHSTFALYGIKAP